MWFWNLMYYFLYLGVFKIKSSFQLAILNFFVLFLKPFYFNRSINLQYLKNLHQDWASTSANTTAQIILSNILLFIEIGILGLVQIITKTNIYSIITESRLGILVSIIFCVASCQIFNYFFLNSNNQREKYKKVFDKMPASKRREYSWLCFFMVLFIYIFGIASLFLVVKYRMN